MVMEVLCPACPSCGALQLHACPNCGRIDPGVASAIKATSVRVDPAQRAKPIVQKDPGLTVRLDLATPPRKVGSGQ